MYSSYKYKYSLLVSSPWERAYARLFTVTTMLQTILQLLEDLHMIILAATAPPILPLLFRASELDARLTASVRSLDASSHAIVLWFLSLGRCPPCSLLTLHRPPRTPNRGRLHPPTGSSSTFRLCSRKALNPSDVTRCALAVFRYEKVMFQMIFLYLTTLARTSGAPHRPPRLQSRLLACSGLVVEP